MAHTQTIVWKTITPFARSWTVGISGLSSLSGLLSLIGALLVRVSVLTYQVVKRKQPWPVLRLMLPEPGGWWVLGGNLGRALERLIVVPGMMKRPVQLVWGLSAVYIVPKYAPDRPPA
jgi:hypothetical protein